LSVVSGAWVFFIAANRTNRHKRLFRGSFLSFATFVVPHAGNNAHKYGGLPPKSQERRAVRGWSSVFLRAQVYAGSGIAVNERCFRRVYCGGVALGRSSAAEGELPLAALLPFSGGAACGAQRLPQTALLLPPESIVNGPNKADGDCLDVGAAGGGGLLLGGPAARMENGTLSLFNSPEGGTGETGPVAFIRSGAFFGPRTVPQRMPKTRSVFRARCWASPFL
jgi:hypothetical protein